MLWLHPMCAFSYIKRISYPCKPAGTAIAEVLAALYGVEVARQMLESWLKMIL
jgi:hypothetical protein